METSDIAAADWWRNQRTNYTYVAIAAGILFFLGYVTIWETFYGLQAEGASGLTVLGGILMHLLMHLLLWVPFLLLEIYAFRLLPIIDARYNPEGIADVRKLVVVVGCVIVCLLPILLPAGLIIWHG